VIEYDARSWFRLLLRLRGSVVPALALRVLGVAALGLLAAWLHERSGFHVPSLAHTMLGAALGLLLVFRTNSSYDRFWEGRRLLGMMVNRARDLERQAVSYIQGEDAAAARERAEVRRLITLLYVLIRQYLRRERELDPLVAEGLLSSEERARLEPVAVRPVVAFTWISLRLAACAQAGRLTEHRLVVMDQNLTSFSDSWGGAERILKTPIPFAYAHHIKAFLALFAFTLPFALSAEMRWFTPLAAAAIAFALFGIDEIGVEIEDPFGYDPNDLPLDDVGVTIARDVADILALAPPARDAAAAAR
jgi:putative membrane protein